MKPFEVGKLYSCSGYFLMLYPDKETAVAADLAPSQAGRADLFFAARTSPADAEAVGAYWSKRFGKPVSYCDPKTPLLVLTVEEKYVEILAGDQKGWIINEDSLEIKEISCS